MAGMKEAVLALREEVLLAAEANDKRTMQKCAQTLLAATGLKMLASRMEKTAISSKLLRRAEDAAGQKMRVAMDHRHIAQHADPMNLPRRNAARLEIGHRSQQADKFDRAATTKELTEKTRSAS